MDIWADDTKRGEECLAQIGQGSYQPQHMRWHPSLPETAFAKTVQDADVVVSHAGMGSAITALRYNTPIVMLPRRYDANEHTTDHQMATARWLETKPGIFIAWDEAQLPEKINAAETWSGAETALAPFAPKDFTDRLSAQFKLWADPP